MRIAPLSHRWRINCFSSSPTTQKVKFLFISNVEPRSLPCFVCRKSSSTNKVEPDKTESEVTHEQTTPNQEVSTPRQSTPPLQSLQPPRQTIRTNRAFDLRTAAQLHNP